MKRWVPGVALALLALSLPVLVRAGPPPGAPGCPVFPADNVWRADVSRLPVHARSPAWLSAMGGPNRRLHPDFGPNGDDQPYGIPYTVVDSRTQRVRVTFEYAEESDPGPYPFGSDTPIEGGSDRHALMIDRDRCLLYELYAATYAGNGSTAGSGAVFDLRANRLRPAGWTSADAAGLPVFPGLLRLDEVRAGRVDHAIRVTAQRTDRSYVWPARHQAGAASDANLPPMGARFRLKRDFHIAHYRADTQVVLRAFQTYGLILADNGSNWYFTGTSERGWDTALLDELKSIPASAFEAVDTSSLVADPNSARVRGAPAPAPTPAPAPAPRPSPRPAPSPTTTSASPGTTTASTTTTSSGASSSSSSTTTTTEAAGPTGDGGEPGPLAAADVDDDDGGGKGQAGAVAIVLAVLVLGGLLAARRRSAGR